MHRVGEQHLKDQLRKKQTIPGDAGSGIQGGIESHRITLRLRLIWRSLGPSPLLKHRHLELAAQDCVLTYLLISLTN